jgi:bifunctional enzyme CysN/CysC
MRFPVQYVNRPNLDFRGYCGTLAAGIVQPGDTVTALPSGKTSKVSAIVTQDGNLDRAFPPQAITITLEDAIDISRGDMLVKTDNLPHVADRLLANIVWMIEAPLKPGKQYYIKQACRTITGSISAIKHRIDVNTLEQFDANALQLNEIGLCEVALNAPIAFDAYQTCKGTGSFIIIDRVSNVTIGAGMITGAVSGTSNSAAVSVEERATRYSQQAAWIELTGTNAIALGRALERQLFDAGHACVIIKAMPDVQAQQALNAALQQAGLICIYCHDSTTASNDTAYQFDADTIEATAILERLKADNIVF